MPRRQTAELITTAIEFLRERVTRAPRVVVILGSGLSSAADEFEDPLTIDYEEIPGFPRATVAGHTGAVRFGVWNGMEIAAMLGRFHLYEGWPADAVVTPLRALRALGADHLVVTNAAGSLHPDLRPGDLMLIEDHINFMFRNPLIGPVGVGEERFPDMSEPYDAGARAAAREVAIGHRIALTEGVYAGVLGPSYETVAEIAMLRQMGADVVGMSTVPEVVAARALGMRVLGVSCVTNDTGSRNGPKLSHAEVLSVAAEASDRLRLLIHDTLPRLVPPNLPTEAASG